MYSARSSIAILTATIRAIVLMLYREGYYYEDCDEEGGMTERITLPLMDITEVRKWIETLFYDPYNTWTSPMSYEPDGAGCYYEIIDKSGPGVLLICI